MSSLPLIQSSHVHCIQSFCFSDFYKSLENFNLPFKFMAKIEDYADYYKSFERNVKKQKRRPMYIEWNFNSSKELRPIRMYHAFDSFWKDFRIKAETNDSAFFLLPLKINLNSELGLSANNKRLDCKPQAYAYLFPFGIMNVNFQINYNYESTFEDLIKQISNFRKPKKGSIKFTTWAKKIAQEINENLFKKSSPVDNYRPHTMVFLDETNFSPVDQDMDHCKAITGLIDCDTKFQALNETYVNGHTKCKLPKLWENEVLIFNPKTTFIYASPNLSVFQKKCMRQNYAAFLNFIFAVKQLLRSYNSKKINPSHKLLITVKKAFESSFSSEDDYSLSYFNKIYPIVAEEIGLNSKIKEFLGVPKNE